MGASRKALRRTTTLLHHKPSRPCRQVSRPGKGQWKSRCGKNRKILAPNQVPLPECLPLKGQYVCCDFFRLCFASGESRSFECMSIFILIIFSLLVFLLSSYWPTVDVKKVQFPPLTSLNKMNDGSAKNNQLAQANNIAVTKKARCFCACVAPLCLEGERGQGVLMIEDPLSNDHWPHIPTMPGFRPPGCASRR